MKRFRYVRIASLRLGLFLVALFLPSSVRAGEVPGQEVPQESAVTLIFVDRDAAGANNGTSWANAYTQLQSALDWTNTHGTTGYEIWVAEGIYYPDEGGSHVNDRRTESFTLAWDNVRLYGGFAGNETLGSQRDWIAHPTILSGDIDQDAEFTNNAYHVFTLDGNTYQSLTNATLIDGFTITAGNANGSFPHNSGGGLFCSGNGSGHMCSPTLAHLVFHGNMAQLGGGMSNRADNYGISNPSLTEVTFSHNQATDDGSYGGGMFNECTIHGTSNPVLTHVSFNDNWSINGGGMYSAAFQCTSSPILKDVSFSNNDAANGGGMFNHTLFAGITNPVLTDVAFDDNWAANNGGGMVNRSTNDCLSNPILTRVTFDNNQATNNGGGLFYEIAGLAVGDLNMKLTEVAFRGNRANAGGGMFNRIGYDRDNSTLINVTFSGNQATTHGGGMVNLSFYNGESNSNLINVIFSGNQAGSYGGGMCNQSGESGISNPTLTNVIFSGNRAVTYGGGIANFTFFNGMSNPILIHVTLSGNRAETGGGIYNNGLEGVNHLNLVNSILWGNAASEGPQIFNYYATPILSYSDIEGGYPGMGNLNLYPQFIAPIAASAAPTTAGNLRLASSSPLIDAGNNFSVTVATDLDHTVRKVDLPTPNTGAGPVPPVDMGAYEAHILHVDRNAVSSSHDGLSWSSAYLTLQDALDWTNTHGASAYEIWVAEGIYYPDEGTGHGNNNRSETFHIAWNNLQLYGGFAGYETLRTQREWTVHSTTLSGDIDQDGAMDNNAYHVLYLDGATSQSLTEATVIDGFTIKGGNANGNSSHDSGGGLYCNGQGEGHECSPMLTDLIFSGNRSSRYGGGLHSDGSNHGLSNPNLIHVTFSENQSARGGGMNSTGANNGISSPHLTQVIFSGNRAQYGGGMSTYSFGYGVSNPLLTNVIFSGNHGASAGGGMDNEAADMGNLNPTLVNVTFSGNQALRGGGMSNRAYNGGTHRPTLANCILWGNAATYDPQMHNSNTIPNITYSDIWGGCPSGAICGDGMLSLNPKFIAPVEAGAAPTTAGNYQLSLDSPAVDAGNSFSITVAADLDGRPRIYGRAVDLGAYETAILFVDRDAPGPVHDGLSWTTAYTTVQNALDWANAHGRLTCEIWVAGGTYYPDEGAGHVNNHRDETFKIAWNNVRLYGGFVGNETRLDQRDLGAHPTILSGDIDQDGAPAQNAYHVLYLDGITNQALTQATRIDGFTILAGNADGPVPHGSGGGLYCEGAGSGSMCSPTLSHIIFDHNRAGGYGGGMYIDGYAYGISSPSLIHVRFAHNQAAMGGGMYNGVHSGGVGRSSLIDVTFFENEASDSGGGMYNHIVMSNSNNPDLIHVAFINNRAINSGGGMLNGATMGTSNPNLIHVVFSGNQADTGGGMFNWAGMGTSRPNLTNVLFSGNQANTGGGMANRGEIYSDISPNLTNITFSGNRAERGGGMNNTGNENGICAPVLVNSIFWGNAASDGPQIFNHNATPTLTYSDIEGGYSGTGNLNLDPRFIAPIAASAAPTATGNYRLGSSSPAIDAGNNLSVTIAIDLDDRPRIVRGRVDLGPYEASSALYLPLVVKDLN